MISSKQSHTAVNTISITNFDLTSLYLLRSEIQTILQTAEQHLSEFNDDSEQAPLLLDSVAMLKQLASVLQLISLHGGSDLAYALSEGMQSLYDKADSGDERLILCLAQGMITLSRYIEFVLLQETVEPSLLLEAINDIHSLIGKAAVTDVGNERFAADNYHYVSVANPAQNFQSVEDLGLNSDLLTTAYRAGLAVVLAADSSSLSDSDLKKTEVMYTACALIANQSKTLFWRAAAAVTQDIRKLLPLNEAKKSLYIFIDQQFQSYLPADDRRFADLVSFACKQNNNWANELKIQLKENQLDQGQLTELKYFLQGPDQKITSTINELIQQEIDAVKNDINELVNHSIPSEGALKSDSFQPIAEKLSSLASTLQILNLQQASQALRDSVKEVSSWLAPSAAELDQLLNRLMVAENAALTLSKSHTPTAQLQQLNNANISIHQLDSAYLDLIKETRQLISDLEHRISDSDFVDTLPTSKSADSTDNEALQDIPENLKLIAGALRFLQLTDAANTINRLGLTLENSELINSSSRVQSGTEKYSNFAKIADILLATDHQLSSQQLGQPTVKQAVYTANRSLTELFNH